jgi:hypothetical protein
MRDPKMVTAHVNSFSSQKLFHAVQKTNINHMLRTAQRFGCATPFGPEIFDLCFT